MALRGMESNSRRVLAGTRQEHLLRFANELEEPAREQYLQSVLKMDFVEMDQLFDRALASTNGHGQKLDDLMKPLDAGQIEAEERCGEEKLAEYYNRGLLEVANGSVGVILMAGGQGSRLGVTYPKGMYDVGLLSGKTLFQLQAERIQKLQALATAKHGKNGRITWYIMTSGPTYTETLDFLTKNNYFGLHPEDVVLFKQGLLPCFDFEGRIFLSAKDQLALAPDGNGGIYKALEVNGILDDFRKRGIQHLHCHSVDNILVKVADPTFVGYCATKGADCGAKVVEKNSPTECVGVLCNVDGKVQVVEYSEITENTARLSNPDGSLVFYAGNICNHYFSADFLRKLVHIEMPLHVAKKKIPHVDAEGNAVTPSTPNGIKVEKFVFDVFEYSTNFVAWEVPRDSEFSALKNADAAGKDCPRTAKQDLYKLHKKYLLKANAIVEGDEVEISPELSYGGEGLEMYQGQTITAPKLLK